MEPTKTPVGAAPEEHVPLGQLLVDAGLLTPSDLEKVLDDQRRTGGLLGRLLVEGGYVAPTTVALALADQRGGLVKTEYGFATGRLPHRRMPVDEPPLHLVETNDERGRELEREQALRRALDEKRVELELALQAESAARIRAVTALRAAEARIAELIAPRPEAAPAMHHLFVSRPDGYALVTQAGPAPTEGASVELEDVAYRVVRIGASPFAADDAPCAFLERIE